MPRPPTRESRSLERTRRGHLRPWHIFLGSLIFLALVAADCGGPWVSSVQILPGETAFSEGEPTVMRALVQGDAHPGSFCYIAEAVTWTTADPSVAIVAETGTDDDESYCGGYDCCRSPFAIIRAVGSGSTEVIATSDFDPAVEDRASITVTDDFKPGFIELVDGARATTVGETLAVEVDVALYGAHDPQAAAIEWEIDDPAVVTTEDASLHEIAPYVYRSTLILRGAQAGVVTVRATHPLEAAFPWDPTRPLPEVPVTIAPEAGIPFVVIRGGDRTVDLDDGICVEAYVGMPAADLDGVDAWIDWSLTIPDVLALGGLSWIADHRYPFDVVTCLTALGPGVTELVATSSTWPDASARVSIKVIE